MTPSRPLERRKPKRFRGLFLKSAVVVGILVNVLVAAGGIVALENYERFRDDFVPPEAMAVNQASRGAKILDRNGELLYQYVDDDGVRIPVGLDEISPALVAATIATEDSSFFANAGVNVKGLARAVVENLNLKGESEEFFEGSGGSSITQQLIKNVYIPADQRLQRSISRKIREVVYSIEITKRYEKSQILNWYLNQVSYGGIYTGVESASRAYFGKSASDLTLAEAALLAGIPQSPARFDPLSNPEAAVARRNEVLDLMAEHAAIQTGPHSHYVPNYREIAAARDEPLEVLEPSFPVEAPHFVYTYIGPLIEKLVGREALLRDGLVVTTTLDLDLQHEAEDLIELWVSEFEAISNTHNGAAIVLEPSTGEILAMVGSRDFWREDIDGNVNNLMAGNSPGSSFKPFVYLTTFEELGWRASTIIQDTPVRFVESDGTVFQPTNPSGGYHGAITLRDALGNSLNVPAFKAAQAVEVSNIVDFAKSVGFTSLDGHYGPAIAIGGVDLKAFDLAYAYSVIANDGVMVGLDTFAPASPDERSLEPVGILKIEDSSGNVLFDADDHRGERRVIRSEDARMMTDILTDPGARCITFGCGGLSIPGHRVAVKTGTSEPFDPKGPDAGKIGETWAFGYTGDYAVGIWAGNADNQPITHIYSTSIAFRAMRDILLAAYDRRDHLATASDSDSP